MPPRLLSLDDHILLLERFDTRDQRLKDLVHERLQGRCETDARTGCWVFTGYWEENGQGKMRVGGRVYPIQRVSAWLYVAGFRLWDVCRVVHKVSCKNPACFNPDHLEVVSGRAQALRVQREAGRLGNPSRRLGRDKARKLRDMAVGGATPEELATLFGVRLPAVKACLRGVTWREDKASGTDTDGIVPGGPVGLHGLHEVPGP